MFSRSFLTTALLASALTWVAAQPAAAATLQFTLTNLAPADTLGIDPLLFIQNAQEAGDIVFLPGPETMETLPLLTFLLTLDRTAATFPPAGGGQGLPLLLPGDSLTFSLSGIDLTGDNFLQYGGSLFTSTVLSAPGGNFMPVDLTLTAGALAEFDNTPALILPDSTGPGPAGINPASPVLRLAIVPEPGSSLLALAGFSLALRRRRP